MRQLVIDVTCDLCQEHVPEENAEEWPFSLGKRSFKVDLCDSCLATRVDDLTVRELESIARLEKDDSPREKAKVTADPVLIEFYDPKRDEYVCPYDPDVCGCTGGSPVGCDFTAKTAGALSTHFKRMHGVNLKSYAREAGLVPA